MIVKLTTNGPLLWSSLGPSTPYVPAATRLPSTRRGGPAEVEVAVSGTADDADVAAGTVDAADVTVGSLRFGVDPSGAVDWEVAVVVTASVAGAAPGLVVRGVSASAVEVLAVVTDGEVLALELHAAAVATRSAETTTFTAAEPKGTLRTAATANTRLDGRVEGSRAGVGAGVNAFAVASLAEFRSVFIQLSLGWCGDGSDESTVLSVGWQFDLGRDATSVTATTQPRRRKAFHGNRAPLGIPRIEVCRGSTACVVPDTEPTSPCQRNERLQRHMLTLDRSEAVAGAIARTWPDGKGDSDDVVEGLERDRLLCCEESAARK